MGKGPLATLDFVLIGARELEQVAERIADDVVVAFVIIAVLLQIADNFRDIDGNRRLFRNDESLHDVLDKYDERVQRFSLPARAPFFRIASNSV